LSKQRNPLGLAEADQVQVETENLQFA